MCAQLQTKFHLYWCTPALQGKTTNFLFYRIVRRRNVVNGSEDVFL